MKVLTVIVGFVLAMQIAYGISMIVLVEDMRDLRHRMDELNCIHMIEEDGSAYHADAEIAIECLRAKLGWTNFPADSPDRKQGP